MKLIINSIKLTVAVAMLTAVAAVFVPQQTIYEGCKVSIADTLIGAYNDRYAHSDFLRCYQKYGVWFDDTIF